MKSHKDPPARLLTNVNKKMVFFIEGFPYRLKDSIQVVYSNLVKINILEKNYLSMAINP